METLLLTIEIKKDGDGKKIGAVVNSTGAYCFQIGYRKSSGENDDDDILKILGETLEKIRKDYSRVVFGFDAGNIMIAESGKAKVVIVVE